MNVALLCIGVTILSYWAALYIFRTIPKPWLHPLYTGTALLSCILAMMHIDSTQYTEETATLRFFLGTATVSLAVPLYKQIQVLRRYFSLLIGGAVVGTSAGILSAYLLARGLHLSHELILSLIPKSVTLPIALSVSDSLGGIPPLTIFFVITSGIFSLAIGPKLLHILKIKSGVARGLALGTSAQALGASKALEWGETEGAVGSAAMGIAALTMALLAPLLTMFHLF